MKSFAPHSQQNFRVSRFAMSHFGHFIVFLQGPRYFGTTWTRLPTRTCPFRLVSAHVSEPDLLKHVIALIRIEVNIPTADFNELLQDSHVVFRVSEILQLGGIGKINDDELTVRFERLMSLGQYLFANRRQKLVDCDNRTDQVEFILESEFLSACAFHRHPSFKSGLGNLLLGSPYCMFIGVHTKECAVRKA